MKSEGVAPSAAAALGAAPSDFVRATYRELQEKDAAARGVVAGDMLLPATGGTEQDT